MKSFVLLQLVIFFYQRLPAQQIEIVNDYRETSIRGLSVVNDQVIWVSGSAGTVGRSVNGGKSWKWIIVKKFEKNDFRDIEAFDENTAVIMAIAEPAYILKTKDGGNTWKIVFTDSTKGMFLDAMDFSDEKYGYVVGDPVNQFAFLAYTKDQGDTWIKKEQPEFFRLDEGESLFASSGTNIKSLSTKNKSADDFLYVTGGKKSRLFFKQGNELNMIQGQQSQGANSVAVNHKGKGIIVGGDFSKDTISSGNCSLFSTNNKTLVFETPVKGPYGYKSCVEFVTEVKVICCGTSGVDVSENAGKTWSHISPASFHVCKKAKHGNSIFLAGINGKIGRLKW